MASARETLKAAPRAEFGSRTSRRLRARGPGARRRLRRRRGGARLPGRPSARSAPSSPAARRSSTSSSRARKAVPVVVKEQQLHPVRGSLEHIDLQEVKLDEEIQAEVAIELEGAEDAPGVKEGGVLEHVTREITVEALPTEIPERIVADVSAMEINDTLQLSAVADPRRRQARRRRPRGGHDRHPLAAARRGRARARGRGGDRARRRGGRGPAEGEGEAAEGDGRLGRLRRGVAAVGLFRRRGGRRSRRAHPDRRPRQPRRELRRHPPQRRLRGRRRALAPLGPAAREAEVRRPDRRRARRARRARGSRSCCRRPS